MPKIKGWTKINANEWQTSDDRPGDDLRVILKKTADEEGQLWFVFVQKKRFNESWLEAKNIVNQRIPYTADTKEQTKRFAISFMRRNP